MPKGTPEQAITFTSTRTVPQKGDWSGITVNGSLFLKNAVVGYADFGIKYAAAAVGDQVSITDSVIRHTSGNGIKIAASGDIQLPVTVRNNTVSDNSGTGIYIEALSGHPQLDLRACQEIT